MGYGNNRLTLTDNYFANQSHSDMKKLILTVAALTVSTCAFAQLNLGIKGGLNFSNIRDTHTDFKTSIYIGAFSEFHLNDFLSFQPELIYSRQGGFDKIGGIKYWERLNYLNIPLMAKFYVFEDRLSIDTGPQFGFMLNGRLKAKDGSTVILTKIPSSERKTFDVSWGFGVSYKLSYRFDVSCRYNLGLTKCLDSIGNHKPKNGVIQLGAGLRL